MRNELMAIAIMAGTVVAWLLPNAANGELTITPDVVYGHKHGLAMTMDVFTPQQDAKGVGVMFMVSGGWVSRWTPPERMKGLFQPLLDHGYTVFAVRHGSSPKYTVPEIVPDVRRATRFVRANAERFGVDPDRLGVAGGSAGGHLALMLGTTGDDGDPDARDPVLRASSRVAAVVAYFPPTDLREFANDEELTKSFPALIFDDKLAEGVSPLLHVTSDDAPVLLVHGDQDRLVPISNSTRMLAALKEADVPGELVTIEGAAHGFSGEDAQRAVKAWIDWLDRHLADK